MQIPAYLWSLFVLKIQSITFNFALLLPAVISQRYTAISVVPAAMGKKVRDVAAKVNIAPFYHINLQVGGGPDRLGYIWCLFTLCSVGQSWWCRRKFLWWPVAEWRHANCSQRYEPFSHQTCCVSPQGGALCRLLLHVCVALRCPNVHYRYLEKKRNVPLRLKKKIAE